MKILVINTVPFEQNGITTHIVNYYYELNKRKDIKVYFGATEEVDEKIEKEIEAHQIQIIRFPSRKKSLMRYILTLVKNVKKNKYDIVHVHGNSCTMAFDLIPAMMGGCKIRIAHSHNVTCSHLKLHKLLRIPFDISCTYRFACSTEAGEWLFNNKKFIVIPNGIEIKKFNFSKESRKKIRKTLNIKNEKILGHVGIFNEQKNHIFLLKIFKQCLMDDEKLKLLLIGNGPLEDSIKEQAKEMNLEDKIIFYGATDNVKELLCAMDLFLFPSLYEGLGIALLEAQASGLYCIASNNVPKIVDISGNIDFLSLTVNEKLWIRKIQEHLSDERTGCILRNDKVEKYDINILSEKLYNIFLKLMRQRV